MCEEEVILGDHWMMSYEIRLAWALERKAQERGVISIDPGLF